MKFARLSRQGSAYRLFRELRTASVKIRKGTSGVHRTASVHISAHIAKDLRADEYAFVGDDCWIGPRTHIGAYSMLAPRVAIVGDDHVWDVVGIPTQFTGRPQQRDTVIGRDVWLGYGVIVMRGLTIGDGAIIAAGSIVTKDVAPFEVWAGSPARRLRMRFAAEDIELHLQRLDAKQVRPNFAEPQQGTQ